MIEGVYAVGLHFLMLIYITEGIGANLNFKAITGLESFAESSFLKILTFV